MKTGFLHLFILSLLFSSCYENDVFVSEPELEAQETLTLKQQAGQDALVMSNLFADMMKAISLSAEVNFDSDERIAQVRNSCPTTFLISDGVYPDTFFVDFDDCDPSAVFDQRYGGAVMFILNGALDDPSVCPLFSIKSSPSNPEFIVQLDNTNRGYGIDIFNKVYF